jgi:hypothetical protein
MGIRTVSPGGLFAVAAALCLFHPIRAQAQSPASTAFAPSGIAKEAEYPEEAPFLAENSAAMDTMMAGMNVSPTGNVDTDFAAVMIPHHQGAIDMATAELRYGRNEQLRRIAQEIIVEQQQEIVAMHLALGQRPPTSAAVPTQVPIIAPAPVSAPPASVRGQRAVPPGSISMSPSMRMR